ncbi:hypothetical protein GIS00_17135 [Nakamurella sp. YIM 132087]|uniref:Uncharacterized protein n=1 Tax=Nakamurella alba TaxID=2665158 RepID=A0A7K1FNK3_9ACTN|nr:hypothetical protein [Nakamurella alba]MTD15660.1 hypothetical protein [Nakamurella alba]
MTQAEAAPSGQVPVPGPTPPTPPTSVAPTGGRRILKLLVDNPIAGFVPWIVHSMLSGENRVMLAAWIALGLSVLLFVSARVMGTRTKILEVVDLVSFGGFVAFALLASAPALTWMETWFGELSNALLVLVVVVSMLLRVPFTVQYAREQVDESLWHAPAFMRINYVITGVWGLAFLVSAVSGYIGDAVLHNSNNLWTGWVIQIFASLTAAHFTIWYPKYARAIGRAKLGIPTDPPPPPAMLLLDLATYLLVIGIIMLVFTADPVWIGVALVVVGAAAMSQQRKVEKAWKAQCTGIDAD